MISEVFRRASVCVAICIVVASGGLSNVNDFKSTMKFLSDAADPKTPLALPYFLAGELRQTDGDSTPKTTSSVSRPTHPAKPKLLMSTKTRHVSKIIDLTGSPTTVYIKNNRGRDYHLENHESPPPVPTRPIYPGQGQWAQRGVTHQPYIYGLPYSNQPLLPISSTPNGNLKKYEENYHNHNVQHQHHKHKYNHHHRGRNHHKHPGSLQNHKTNHTLNQHAKNHKGHSNYQNPSKKNKYKNHNGPKQIEQIHKEKKYEKDGIEIFNRQHNYFQSRFPERIKAPEPDPMPNPPYHHDDYENDDDHEDKDEFVPTRMYAQVRQYETESHLPASIEEPRLKKLVKDSRIHTVYMEEGYEDGAYDHAGQEKHAEEDESQVEHDQRRRRRRSIDPSLTNVDIDTDFIGKTKYSVGEHIREGSNKYPYYDKPDVHHNSPLRYAQDMNDIPKKRPGNMAFYEESEARTRCEDVVDKVNPIPKDLDEGSETPEKTMAPKLPRLKKLGDKLDCFKIRFFGEDPLDSPLFKEEFVGQPKDPFAGEFHKTLPLMNFNRTGKSFRSPAANSARGEFEYKEISESAINEYVQDAAESDTFTGGLHVVAPPNDLANPVESDMGMVMQPAKREMEMVMNPMSEIVMVMHPNSETSDFGTFNQSEIKKIPNETTAIPTSQLAMSPAQETVIASASDVAVAQLNAAVEAQANGIVDTAPSNDVVAASSLADDDFQPLPEAEALRMRRLTRRRKRPHQDNKLYAGRYTSHKPLPPYSSHPRRTPTTTAPPQPFPAQNTISEVYYKDQIKPDEQLNVFADVINHIQNMSRDDAYIAASDHHAQVLPTGRPGSINTQLRTGQRKKKRKFPVMKTTQQLYNEYVRRSKNNPSRIHDEITQETNAGTVNLQHPFARHFYNNGETLVYTTIDVPMNKFLVPGMKPPLAHEKPMIYSDYQSENILKRQDWLSNHRISRRKRGTRNNYSEIRRQPARKPQDDPEEEDEEDDDDYVPHRLTNYHYDPDTDRIIYDMKPTTESVEVFIDAYLKEAPEEELEEDEGDQKDEKEEKTETSTLKSVPHRTVSSKDALKSDNGKTIVDYLKILKSHPSYKFIPDPTTTEKPTTENPPTTQNPASTTPPAFVNLLHKLHTMDGYKQFEDEDPKKKKPKTTTQVPIEEEEEEEEIASVQVPIQNSPGGQFNQDLKLQIFDINEYLPKVKTYTPRTAIDYSKYKTIERTTSRHNLSSRYSEEEDELPLTRGTEPPVVTKYRTAPPRPKTPPPKELEEDDESEEEAVKEENVVTTPFTTTTTTISRPASKIRIRGRGRPTRRPTQTTTKEATRTTAANEASEEAAVYTPATHRPPSRVYPRRQRPKIRMRSTTSSPSREDNDQPEAKQLNQEDTRQRKHDSKQASQEAKHDDDEPIEAQSRRRTIRRLDHIVPANHKPAYTPVTISKRMDDHPIILVQRQPRLVTPEIINYNRTGGVSRPGEINPRKIAIRRKGARYIGNAGDGGRKTLINGSDLDSTLEHEKDDKVKEKAADVHRSVSSRNSGGNSVTVKFIRDPNKRLYFYAPL